MKNVNKTISKITALGKAAAKKTAKTSKKASSQPRNHVSTSLSKAGETPDISLPTVEDIRAAIRPEGTTIGELMKHFEVRPEVRKDMINLLASIDSLVSASTMSEEYVNDYPLYPQDPTGQITPGFRPVFDRRRQLSRAEIAFGRPSVPRHIFSPVSPGRFIAAAGASRPFSPSKSSLKRTWSAIPSPGKISPTTAGTFPASSPRKSDFGRMASVSVASPMQKFSVEGSTNTRSPRRSDFWSTTAVSGSPRISKTPPTPFTPQSPFMGRSREPAKITVSASTKQEADGVLARQQLVRESLFELRGILTNLNWKVQQFEALVDRAEKDVVWDTAADDQIPTDAKSGKKLRFLFDD